MSLTGRTSVDEVDVALLELVDCAIRHPNTEPCQLRLEGLVRSAGLTADCVEHLVYRRDEDVVPTVGAGEGSDSVAVWRQDRRSRIAEAELGV